MKHAEAFTSVIGRTRLMKFHSGKLRNKSRRNVLTLHRIMGNRGASSMQPPLFFFFVHLYFRLNFSKKGFSKTNYAEESFSFHISKSKNVLSGTVEYGRTNPHQRKKEGGV